MHNKKIIRNLQTEKVTPAKDFIIVILVASAVLLLKLFVSYNVYGTNDITYWIKFAETIQRFGTFKIYSLITIYNHPPLISWFLKLIKIAEVKTGLGFPFLFRLLPIFADYMSVFIIWQLLKKYNIKHKKLVAIACAVNPINFFVSGFHGNDDSVFIFLVLLAIYLAENRKIVFSGIIYGLSMCIKIVPIILFPIFIFYMKEKREKVFFLICCILMPLVVFTPYLINDYHSVIKNIFQYSSLKGIWGIGHILNFIFTDQNIGLQTRKAAFDLFKFHILYAMPVFLLLMIILSSFLMTSKKTNLINGTFLTLCLFLVLTPGFGVQYLVWLSFFAVIVFPVLGSLYLLVGGLFLYRVYFYWSGGKPPYYANSDVVGQWIGFEKTLDLVLWFIILVMLIKFFANKNVLEALVPGKRIHG